MTPGKEGTTPMAQGTNGHGTTKNARNEALNKTKQNKNKEKIKLVGILVTSGGKGGRGKIRREDGSRILLLQRADRPPAVRQVTMSL